MSTPPPMVSKRYLTEVGEPSCLKSIFVSAVMSVNVTGDGACGPGGGGVLGRSPELYERPAWGVGVGVGCCANIGQADPSTTRIRPGSKHRKLGREILSDSLGAPAPSPALSVKREPDFFAVLK